VQEIVDIAAHLQSHQDRYSHQCFQRARDEREAMIFKLKVPHLQENICDKLSILTSEVEKIRLAKHKQPWAEHEQAKTKLRESLQELRKQIESEDNGYGFLTDILHMVDKVEHKLNNRGNETDFTPWMNLFKEQ
jgi:hypothetical protein